MKRIFSFGLVLALLLTSIGSFALAEGAILVNQPDRGLVAKGTTAAANPLIEGESPTTGQPWTGDYFPVLVQISVKDGGVAENTQPWGISSADILYETPLHKAGHTRFSALFSDTFPENAGPVRSARVEHAEIREEWDSGFVFWGQQEYKKTNVKDTFRETGANKKDVLFNGTDGGKKWTSLFWRVKGLGGPDNVDTDVQAMHNLKPEGFSSPNRPYLFTNENNYQGDAASTITITQRHPDYSSLFTYDSEKNQYVRFVGKDNLPFVDKYTQEQVAFSNVIVQRTDVSYIRNDAPMVTLIGSGNADIFIGGKYIPGYWVRSAMNERTVFYDESGNELQLQRGKTLISITDNANEVAYQ